MQNCRILVYVGAPSYDEVDGYDYNAGVHQLDVSNVGKLPKFERAANSPRGGTDRNAAWRLLHEGRDNVATNSFKTDWLKRPLSFCETNDSGVSQVSTGHFPVASEPGGDVHTREQNEQELYETSFEADEESVTSSDRNALVTVSQDGTLMSFDESELAPMNNLHAPHLRHISKLPSAAHIQSIVPQTITVDLVVGVVMIQPTRRVTVRKTGREVDLVELMVGDNTNATLALNFWLSLESQGQSLDLRMELQDLKVGDVVLMRNVALSQFKGKVHGQSLSCRQYGRASRWGTSICVVSRRKRSYDQARVPGSRKPTDLEGSGFAEADLLTRKIEDVLAWTGRFVVPIGQERANENGSGALNKIKKRLLQEALPPDETP